MQLSPKIPITIVLSSLAFFPGGDFAVDDQKCLVSDICQGLVGVGIGVEFVAVGDTVGLFQADHFIRAVAVGTGVKAGFGVHPAGKKMPDPQAGADGL